MRENSRMGMLARIARREPALPVIEAVPIEELRPVFSTAIDSGVLYGVPSLDDWIFNRMRVSRDEALRVPAVKRARDLICGEIGQFPLRMYNPDGRIVDWSLLDQPELGVARSVSMTRLVEDLLLTGRGWWATTNVAWHGRPSDVRRLEPETVTVQPDRVTYPWGTAEVWPEHPGLIRFESPNPGLLNASAAIRACVALERATLNYVDGAPPIDYLTPSDGVDPADDTEIQEMLDAWAQARRTRGTAYIPAGLTYNTGGWDPEKLQLASAREFAITEIARLTGIDADELSVNTTSRTYANMQDRRRQRIDSVLGPYMTAIEGRVAMDDLTPHGYTVAFDTTSYLRLDDLSAAQADVALVGAEILTRDEARTKRGLEPLGPAGATPTALPSTQEPASA